MIFLDAFHQGTLRCLRCQSHECVWMRILEIAVKNRMCCLFRQRRIYVHRIYVSGGPWRHSILGRFYSSSQEFTPDIHASAGLSREHRPQKWQKWWGVTLETSENSNLPLACSLLFLIGFEYAIHGCSEFILGVSELPESVVWCYPLIHEPLLLFLLFI